MCSLTNPGVLCLCMRPVPVKANRYYDWSVRERTHVKPEGGLIVVIKEGARFAFLAFAVIAIVLDRSYRKVKSGVKPYLRKLPGIVALEEAIGRGAEMGRPVHFTSGSAGFDDEAAAQTLAGLICLSHIAKLCAKYDVRLLVSNRRAEVHPLTEEIVRQSFLSEGKVERFRETDIRFFSDDQFAYGAGVLGVISGEKTAANIMLGAFWAESLFFAEAAATYGNIQIAGTANTAQIPFFVTACDYCLIGEELYAAAARFSDDPAQVATLIMEDVLRVAIVCLIVVGAITVSLGSNVVKTFVLKW